MDAKKLINKYIDVIEDAFELGVAPETLGKMIWSNKTKPDIKIKVLAAFVKFIRNKKNPRAAAVAFAKSAAFKKAVPAAFAKQKKFFDKKLMSEFYFTTGYKTLLKDLSKAEFKRFKFIEHIYGEHKKGQGPLPKGGIASMLSTLSGPPKYIMRMMKEEGKRNPYRDALAAEKRKLRNFNKSKRR